jgi:hypothetical protein
MAELRAKRQRSGGEVQLPDKGVIAGVGADRVHERVDLQAREPRVAKLPGVVERVEGLLRLVALGGGLRLCTR